MTRRLALTALAAALLLVADPALAQESIDSGDWAGSRVVRPPALASEGGGQVEVVGQYRGRKPFPTPTILWQVGQDPDLPAECPSMARSGQMPRPDDSSSLRDEFSTYAFGTGIQLAEPCNGQYEVAISGSYGFNGRLPRLTTEIVVAIPPPTVNGVRVDQADDGDALIVSWDPVETAAADFLGYRVERSVDGGGYEVIGLTQSSAQTFTDGEPPAAPVSYRVLARRGNGSGGEIASAPSGSDSIDLTPADSGADGDGDGDAGGGPGGTPGSGGGSPAGGGSTGGSVGGGVRPPVVGRSSGRPFPPLTTSGPPTTVDDGYSETLPFEDREPGSAEPVLPDDELASVVYEDEVGRGLAIPIATALVLAVWAFHLRFLARAARPSA